MRRGCDPLQGRRLQLPHGRRLVAGTPPYAALPPGQRRLPPQPAPTLSPLSLRTSPPAAAVAAIHESSALFSAPLLKSFVALAPSTPSLRLSHLRLPALLPFPSCRRVPAQTGRRASSRWAPPHLSPRLSSTRAPPPISPPPSPRAPHTPTSARWVPHAHALSARCAVPVLHTWWPVLGARALACPSCPLAPTTRNRMACLLPARWRSAAALLPLTSRLFSASSLPKGTRSHYGVLAASPPGLLSSLPLLLPLPFPQELRPCVCDFVKASSNHLTVGYTKSAPGPCARGKKGGKQTPRKGRVGGGVEHGRRREGGRCSPSAPTECNVISSYGWFLNSLLNHPQPSLRVVSSVLASLAVLPGCKQAKKWEEALPCLA